MDIDRKEQRRLKSKEYEQQPHRKEKRRDESIALAKQKKIINTMLRLESHTQDELLHIAMLKCDELVMDYKLYETALKTAIAILGGSRNVQSDRTEHSISDLQTNQSFAQPSNKDD